MINLNTGVTVAAHKQTDNHSVHNRTAAAPAKKGKLRAAQRQKSEIHENTGCTIKND